MNDRERFTRYVHFESTDRIPLHQVSNVGYWPATLDRWRKEGLPDHISNKEQALAYFGFDKSIRFFLDSYPLPRFVTRTIKETDRTRTMIDECGVTKEVSRVHHDHMPKFIDFPLKSKHDWERMKWRFNPDDLRRYPIDWSPELIEYSNNADHPVFAYAHGFFWILRTLMGTKNLLISFYRIPDLIHEIMDYWSEFLVNLTRKLITNIRIDYFQFSEDMAYKRGPHISPKLFEEFMVPNYRKVTSFMRSHGVDVISVDTDGDYSLLIPQFLEAGVNCFVPNEAASGIDVVELRGRYGEKLVFWGNIDKRVLGENKKAIQDEVTRKLSITDEGGYIPDVDHSTPYSVPFENYMYYIDLLKKNFHPRP